MNAKISAAVTADLAMMSAATAADLVPGAAPRPLLAASVFPLPYSEGKTLVAVVGLAPGPPASWPVPTQLESLRFVLALDAQGEPAITARPARPDLELATRRALAQEARAADVATAALLRAGIPLPPGKDSWRAAARAVTYDSRLPAAQHVGPPGWSLIFEPWSDAHGWNHVLLDEHLNVLRPGGQPP